MREIKFRAWDERNKYIEDDFLMKSNWEAWYLEHSSWYDWTFDYFEEDHNLIVMQYTWLKDKNGKEIYEGDVVEVFNNIYWEWCKIIWKQSAWIHEVIFFMGSFEIKWWWTHNLHDCEIIWNIYENPELLNDNK